MKFHYFPEKGKAQHFKIDIKKVQSYLDIFPQVAWGNQGLFINGQPVEFLCNNLACTGYFHALSEEQQGYFSNVIDSVCSQRPELDAIMTEKKPQSLVLVSCVFGLYAVAIANNCQANLPSMSKEDTMKTTKSSNPTNAENKFGKKVENIIGRVNATIDNINKRGVDGKKATLNQARALVHYFVASHKLLSNKTLQQNEGLVAKLRNAVKQIRELLGENHPALDSYTREKLVEYTTAQEARMATVKAETAAWGRSTAALTNGVKGKAHAIWTATLVTAHYAWEWASKTAWPAIQQAASDVWDWARNLFTRKPVVEDNPRRSNDVIDVEVNPVTA